uniref:outer membrane beta-barrel protein n=1 Tax=Roseivirga sp. TaxID=1964215 RepID=UPI0040480AED
MSNFEDDLKNMFDGAEFAPSDQLWTGIEGGLKAKKKNVILLYWQTYGVAAALVLIITFTVLFNQEPKNGVEPSAAPLTELKDKPEEKKAQIKADSVINTVDKSLTSNDLDKKQSSIVKREEVLDHTKSDTPNLVDQKLMASTNDDKGIKPEFDNESITSSELIILKPNLMSEQIEATQFASIILPQLPLSITIIKARWEAKHLVEPMMIETPAVLLTENNFERLLSLNGGIGSSSFNPNASGTSSQFSVAEFSNYALDPGISSVRADITNGDNRQLGSFAVGAGVGLELNPRWSLVMFARYAEYRFANESNAISVEGQRRFPIYIPAGFDGHVGLVPIYQLTNSLTSITIPVEAAYKVLDLGSFDLDVKGGVSLDYFISYKIEGDLPFLSTRKLDFSNSSLFKRFNIGPTGGLGLNYELNPQWGLSADLFGRKYIGGLKEEGNYQSRPFIYGFSFNLRYFLRKDND